MPDLGQGHLLLPEVLRDFGGIFVDIPSLFPDHGPQCQLQRGLRGLIIAHL